MEEADNKCVNCVFMKRRKDIMGMRNKDDQPMCSRWGLEWEQVPEEGYCFKFQSEYENEEDIH